MSILKRNDNTGVTINEAGIIGHIPELTNFKETTTVSLNCITDEISLVSNEVDSLKSEDAKLLKIIRRRNWKGHLTKRKSNRY